MSQGQEVAGLVLIGLGLGANAAIWLSFLLMRWSRPKTRRWDGKRVV